MRVRKMTENVTRQEKSKSKKSKMSENIRQAVRVIRWTRHDNHTLPPLPFPVRLLFPLRLPLPPAAACAPLPPPLAWRSLPPPFPE
jgi:hypothetical protein